MLSLLLILVQVALANPRDDLFEAANPEIPEKARLEAFHRLVRAGATDISLISETSARQDADTRQRWVSIRALGVVGGDRPRTLLLQLLQDPQPAIRAAAAQGLGDTGDRTVAPQLAAMLQDPAVIVRAAAAEALGKLREPSTVDALSQAISARDSWYRGSSLWVRSHYVVALGQMGSRKAIPTLLRCLDDADPNVITAALGAFEQVAGFSYAEGRDLAQQKDAWRRWAQAQM